MPGGITLLPIFIDGFDPFPDYDFKNMGLLKNRMEGKQTFKIAM